MKFSHGIVCALILIGATFAQANEGAGAARELYSRYHHQIGWCSGMVNGGTTIMASLLFQEDAVNGGLYAYLEVSKSDENGGLLYSKTLWKGKRFNVTWQGQGFALTEANPGGRYSISLAPQSQDGPDRFIAHISPSNERRYPETLSCRISRESFSRAVTSSLFSSPWAIEQEQRGPRELRSQTNELPQAPAADGGMNSAQ